METILVIGALVGVLAFFAWLAAASKREGVISERERQQRKAIDDAEDANRVRRDIARRGAADRLRESKWNTSNMPDDGSDHGEQRRSTDRRDGGADIGA